MVKKRGYRKDGSFHQDSFRDQQRTHHHFIVQTWIRDDDEPLNLNHYSLNFSDENQPVEVFPPFYHPEDLFYCSRIIGCCNGLVCIRTSNDNETVIWNPSIRKYKKLPSEPTGRDLPSSLFGYMFFFFFG